MEAWPTPSDPLAGQTSGSADASEQGHHQQPLQHGRYRAGRSTTHSGDPDSTELTEAERRRLKRRLANRESARRVRQKRVDAQSTIQGRLEQMQAHVSLLYRQLKEAEVERRVLVHKLAHVVREHQAVVEAMPDIAEPPPAGSVSTNAMQAPAVTAMGAAYMHPHMNGAAVATAPLRSSPAVPMPPCSVQPPPTPQAPLAAAAASRYHLAAHSGAGATSSSSLGRGSSGSPLQPIAAHPVAPARGPPAAAALSPARWAISSSSCPRRFSGSSTGAAGGAFSSYDLRQGASLPAASHGSPSTAAAMPAASHVTLPCLPRSRLRTQLYGGWQSRMHMPPRLQSPPHACMPEEMVNGQSPQDLDMLRSLLEGF